MRDLVRCTAVSGVVAKTQRILGGHRSRVGVVSDADAHSPSRNDLRPGSVDHGSGDDDQEVQGPHGGVLESRVRLSMVVCKEGVRMRFWDVGECC